MRNKNMMTVIKIYKELSKIGLEWLYSMKQSEILQLVINRFGILDSELIEDLNEMISIEFQEGL